MIPSEKGSRAGHHLQSQRLTARLQDFVCKAVEFHLRCPCCSEYSSLSTVRTHLSRASVPAGSTLQGISPGSKKGLWALSLLTLGPRHHGVFPNLSHLEVTSAASEPACCALIFPRTLFFFSIPGWSPLRALEFRDGVGFTFTSS